MAAPSEEQAPHVVRGPGSAGSTLQTRAMERLPGITRESGASKVWLGLVSGAPNETGPPHHHGEAETALYLLSGHVRVYYGEGFEEHVEAGPGDFLFVPAHIHHIEANPYDKPFQGVLARAPDNIVVNLAD
jgi:uncharacterized RmlC-like cupin family protein